MWYNIHILKYLWDKILRQRSEKGVRRLWSYYGIRLMKKLDVDTL